MGPTAPRCGRLGLRHPAPRHRRPVDLRLLDRDRAQQGRRRAREGGGALSNSPARSSTPCAASSPTNGSTDNRGSSRCSDESSSRRSGSTRIMPARGRPLSANESTRSPGPTCGSAGCNGGWANRRRRRRAIGAAWSRTGAWSPISPRSPSIWRASPRAGTAWGTSSMPGRSADAESAYRRALELRACAVAAFPGRAYSASRMSATRMNLGNLYHRLGRLTLAEQTLRQALDDHEAYVRKFTPGRVGNPYDIRGVWPTSSWTGVATRKPCVSTARSWARSGRRPSRRGATTIGGFTPSSIAASPAISPGRTIARRRRTTSSGPRKSPIGCPPTSPRSRPIRTTRGVTLQNTATRSPRSSGASRQRRPTRPH